MLGEPGTLGSRLGLPAGPGNSPGPFSVIDPSKAVLLSPTPAAETTGVVLITEAGSRLQQLTDIPHPALSTISPSSVSFASATHGWVVGTRGAGQAAILATADGGRSWHSSSPPDLTTVRRGSSRSGEASSGLGALGRHLGA